MMLEKCNCFTLYKIYKLNFIKIMNKILVLQLFFSIMVSFANAQVSFQKIYRNNLGGTARAIINTYDNGYLMAVETGPGPVKDFNLIKADMNGDLLWSKKIGGANQGIPYDLVETADSGFIVAGVTKGL